MDSVLSDDERRDAEKGLMDAIEKSQEFDSEM